MLKLGKVKKINKIKNARMLVIFGALLIIGLGYISNPTFAATLMSDNFTGTTIDTGKWIETDPGGLGGAVGNVRQNDALSVTGQGTWGGNRVVSKDNYDRTSGDIEMEVDVTLPSCSGASNVPGVGFGDPGVLTGGGESYTAYHHSGKLYFSRQSANNNAENVVTSFQCTNNVPFHIRIVVKDDQGAALYINGSNTAAATLTGGTFNTKGFFLSSQNGLASFDNFTISGPGTIATPDAPTSLVTAPASSQMSLSWTAPSSNGGAAITDYIVEYKPSSSGSWQTFADGTATATTATVTGLTNGTAYDFRVSAVNSVGQGAVSNTVNATPALSAPTAPQSLAAVNGENAQSSLSWTAPSSNGGAVITDYIVEYKPASGSWQTFADGTATATTATVTGLTNGTAYDFRVSAVNSVGQGAVSNTVNATPSQSAMTDNFGGTTIDTSKWTEVDPAGLGGTVGNVRQNNSLNILAGGVGWDSQNGVHTTATYDRTNGDTSIQFSVTRDSGCGTGVGRVAFGYGDMDFTQPGSASYIVLSNAGVWQLYYWNNGTNAVPLAPLSGISSCTNGTPDTFKLVAKQSGGVDVYVNGSNTVAATIAEGNFTNKSFWFGGRSGTGSVSYDDAVIKEPITGPLAPTSFSASSGSSQVSLDWTAGADNGSPITDYIIEYKPITSSTWDTFNDGTSATTGAVVTGLTNGVNYSFRVSAVNANGTGPISSVATSMPISHVPAAPTASAVSIVGDISVDASLTGSYTFADANGNTESSSEYRWLRADTAGGAYTAIPGATNVNYTVTPDDLGKYLKFEITPVTNVAPLTGSPVLTAASIQVAEVDYVNQILSTGQSLSVGVAANPALSTTQPYSNVMLSGGGGGLGSGTSFTPLVESSVETMSSSMANTITSNDPGNDFDVAVSLHGVSGFTYSQLKKGTAPYTKGMTQVTNAKNAASALGRVSRVIGVTSIHGETDSFNGVNGTTYQNYLEEWQSDYQNDIKAITGQTGDIPLFIDQMSSFASSYANMATSPIPTAQLKASRDNPTKIELVAPKYFLSYSDRHHLTAASSRWLGEYYGKVIKKVVNEHENWKPLEPSAIKRSGNEIYADFHVPAGQLALDTTRVSPRTNYGFEYYDSTASATISSVEVVDADTVKVTLSGVPTGSDQRLRYAYTGVPGTNTGAQNNGSAAGNLRDTDPFPSQYGNTLYNWAVHFNEPISQTANVPSAPSATAGNGQVSLNWSAPANNGNAITDYLIEYKPASSGAWQTFAHSASANTSATVTGLTNGTEYNFRVSAVNSVGTSPASNSASATPATVPSLPVALTATAGQTSVNLNWSAPANNGGMSITDYKVEYKLSADNNWSVYNDGTNLLTNVSIPNLNEKQTYNFRVSAVNSVGDSSFATASAVIPETDSDGDGISDGAENSAPNAGDANNDGVQDSTQDTVASFMNPVTGEYAVLAVDSGDCTNQSQSAISEQSNSKKDKEYSYPLGMIDFSLDCASNSETAGLSQYYYSESRVKIEDLVIRKYNPSTQTYATISDAVIEEVEIDGKNVVKVTYSVTDGGPLDEDGIANGVIVDPSGPALYSAQSAEGSENGSVTGGSAKGAPGAPNAGIGRVIASAQKQAPFAAMLLVLTGAVAAGVSIWRLKKQTKI